MEHKYTVSIDRLAEEKLISHLVFVDNISEVAGDKLYAEYAEALVFISQSPESCPLYILRVQTEEELRYKLFGKRYRIVFRIDDTMVYVHDIQDCRQDTDKSLV